jgi:uncharacterized protein YdiU (UPF0061 family)
MEAYDPATVFSSIDSQGRYAYGNQPRIALWNLTRLAESLLPVLEQESGSQEAAMASATQALELFAPQYEAALLAGLRRKLGLFTERDSDRILAQDLLDCMAANHADFTLTFRRLCDAAVGIEVDAQVRALFGDPGAYDAWASRWRHRLGEEDTSPEERSMAMRLANPAFIPRNHLVEAALNAASERGDFQPFEEMVRVVSSPYGDQPGFERYAMPANDEERVLHTFCGT